MLQSGPTRSFVAKFRSVWSSLAVHEFRAAKEEHCKPGHDEVRIMMTKLSLQHPFPLGVLKGGLGPLGVLKGGLGPLGVLKGRRSGSSWSVEGGSGSSWSVEGPEVWVRDYVQLSMVPAVSTLVCTYCMYQINKVSFMIM